MCRNPDMVAILLGQGCQERYLLRHASNPPMLRKLWDISKACVASGVSELIAGRNMAAAIELCQVSKQCIS